MTDDVIVAYQAKEQVGRLSMQEQESLRRVLHEPTDVEHTSQLNASDRFVSRFGQGMRVHWKKSADGKILVLSVVTA